MKMLTEARFMVDNAGALSLPRRKARLRGKRECAANHYALDQAAVIFPSTLGRIQHHIYNLSVTLRETIDADCLQQALEMMRRRFPTFLVRLKAGWCHYHLETLERPPEIQRGIHDRLCPMSRKELAESCMRVQTEGRELSVDCFHAASDGHGALSFMKTLLAAYLAEKHGIAIPAEKGVLHPDDSPRSGEMEDSYLSCNADGWNTGHLASRAFKHRGSPVAGHAETTITIDASLLHRRAKEQGATVTQYVTSLLLLAGDSLRRPKAPPVRIAVPVDLRSRFPSNTMRNFSISCTVGLKGRRDLPGVLGAVREQLRSQCSLEALAGSVIAVRRLGTVLKGCAPLLVMKNALLKLGYSILGSHSSTMAVSNLGCCELPDRMMPYVEAIACRSDTNPVDTHSCTLLTFRNKAVIRLGRSIHESALEDALCALLSQEQLPIKRTEAFFPFEASIPWSRALCRKSLGSRCDKTKG